tara:strand:- start:1409 stop:1645 length:237 start_codon:yes stop_codon:yes gene_type:complete
MKDTKTKSMIETIMDIVIGFVIYLPINYFVLPLFVDGISEYSIITMLTVSMIYTTIAVARKFTLRRWFVSKPKIFSKV